MKLLRIGLVAATVSIGMALPVSVAHAAASTVTVPEFSAQSIGIDNTPSDPAFKYRFERPRASSGNGSVQFEAANPEASRRAKMYLWRDERIKVADFLRTSFDYYFAPDSKVTNPNQFYLNIYVDVAAIPNSAGSHWYDCRFDYVATAGAIDEWTKLEVAAETAANAVDMKNLAACTNSVALLNPQDEIFRIAFNAGDTSPNVDGSPGGPDNGMKEDYSHALKRI